LRTYLAKQARDGTTKYKILSREDGRFIGRAGISLYSTGEYELGYAFHARKWGKGYATEIAGSIADWFFAKNIAPHFIAFAHPDNLVSQHILKKIGMRVRGPIFIEGIKGVEFEMTAAMRQAVT